MEKPAQPVILDSTPEIMEPVSTGSSTPGDAWGYSDSSPTSFEIPYVEMRLLTMCKLHRDKIMDNIKDLKVKLRGSSLQLAGDLCLELEEMSVPDLTWKDLIASKVISDDSELVQKLTGQMHQNFMRPIQHMQLSLPGGVREICGDFIENFNNKGVDSEGTYVTDIIVPLIQATFKMLLIGGTAFLSIAEKQNLASVDRMGDGKQGKCPDVMFTEMRDGKLYELMFVECLCLVCTKKKKENDKVKLWREMNNGMYFLHRNCRPVKNEFGILGIQLSNSEDVFQLVETLLILKNIMIVNVSLLLHAPIARSAHQKKQSSTVSSDREDN
nr:2455_t:CDS:2 [Entrophospora candida]